MKHYPIAPPDPADSIKFRLEQIGITVEGFFNIRLKQFYRGLIGIGLIRIIVMIVLLGFMVLLVFTKTSKYPDSFYVTGITALLILLVHTKRPDKLFLKTNFTNYKLISFIEYLILSSIIISFLIFHF